MKRNRISAFVMALILMFVMVVPAFAAETRASDQISSYTFDVNPVSGSLEVYFSVTGKAIMSEVGCQNIYVYEKVGSNWILAESFDEDDTGMSRTNRAFHTNSIYCDSEVGVKYQVIVTIFAENSVGRDTRSDTFYVTGI